MLISRKSILSGEVRERELDITEEQVAKREAGALIQDAFPNLSPGDREFYMTGITEEEWDDTFKEPEDGEPV